jgi:hypothetical protein
LIKPDKNVFNPGEKGGITVTVDPSRQRPGRHAYSIVIEYESGSLEPSRLLLYAENKPDIEIPEQVIIRTVGDRPGKSPFTITDYRENVLEIEEIQTSSPQLLARVVEKPTVYLPGWKYVFEASFNGANLVPGDSAESIRLRTSDPEYSILTIPVVIHKIRRIRVAPENRNRSRVGSLGFQGVRERR